MLKTSIIVVTGLKQNCSIVYDDQTMVAVIVDPGGDVDRILALVKELEVSVEAIWLTHGHLDHAGGAEQVKKHFDVKIVGPHEADKMQLENIEEVAARYEEACFSASPDLWLTDGETVKTGEHEFEVRHCPGHSPGHVVYINHANKLILMGDVLFKGSMGRTDVPQGNHQHLLDSIKNQILTLDDDYNFICGHGESSTVGEERRSNPFCQGL